MSNFRKCAAAAFIALAAIGSTFAQNSKLTTVILIRHAEKQNDGTKDPSLTPEGKTRAEKIGAMLKETKVDAVYSTSYKRTRETAFPIASGKQLEVQTYEPMKKEVIDEITRMNQGKTVVLVGHSNTVPWTINQLLGTEAYKDFADDQYNDIVIITLGGDGAAKVVWLNY